VWVKQESTCFASTKPEVQTQSQKSEKKDNGYGKNTFERFSFLSPSNWLEILHSECIYTQRITLG
jgi:hypothetical protein